MYCVFPPAGVSFVLLGWTCCGSLEGEKEEKGRGK